MQTEIVGVTGMTCGGCIGNVTQALKAVSGVGEVRVSLSAGEATVKFDERLTSREKLKSAGRARAMAWIPTRLRNHKARVAAAANSDRRRRGANIYQ